MIDDSIEAYKSLSVAQQYLVKRISRVMQLLEAIPSFRDDTIGVAATRPYYYRLTDLANTVMSFRSNINWESTSRDERLLRALNSDVQFELAQEYSSAENFKQAQTKSDLNGYIGGRAYGMTFDIYLRAMLREDPSLKGSSSFAQPDPWYSKNIDRIEQNLLVSLYGLVEALEKANLVFAAP